MACCGNYGVAEAVAECDSCGGGIDTDGDSVDWCSYSPVDCDVCGSQPCDMSC